MKKLIILVVIIVAGYFAYQHFYIGSQEDYDMEEETAAESEYYITPAESVPIPDNCQQLATNFENALYGHATGQVSFGQRNLASRKLKSCLRAEGLSGSNIENAMKEIHVRVDQYLKQDRAR